MLVRVSGKVYFHQFSSQEDGWEYVVAPDQYQSLPEEDEPREVAPTDRVLIHRVVGGRIVPDWGFWTLVPPWIESRCALATTLAGRDRLVPPARTHFNSRQDTLTGSVGWRRLLQGNRCVLFADAFFEWSDTELLVGRTKQVGRFSLASGDPMAFAGIFSPVRIGDRQCMTVSVVTTSPNSGLESLPHHRMPAILRGDDLRRWMDPASAHPEHSLHSTSDDAMESRILPAKRYRELLIKEV
ncbi:MAG: SOS response-associated peptidase family protein [Fibrobacterota bacterium]|nr:SOS response-associated peptidase family protein [Fibrobacterota bacterium]QQS03257.1 MAG: SOS response-associated peptidase family protein [Fibrobacterota bacterium]